MAREVALNMRSTVNPEPSIFIGRKSHRIDGVEHFAEVAINARPTQGDASVIFSLEAIADLTSEFNNDADYQKHNISSIILSQIDSATRWLIINKRFSSICFEVTIARVRISHCNYNYDRKLYMFLLSGSAGDAFDSFLDSWYASQTIL